MWYRLTHADTVNMVLVRSAKILMESKYGTGQLMVIL